MNKKIDLERGLFLYVKNIFGADLVYNKKVFSREKVHIKWTRQLIYDTIINGKVKYGSYFNYGFK